MTAKLFGWRRVPFPEAISAIAPLYYHNLAIGAHTKQVYTWGCGTFTDGQNDGIIPALVHGRDSSDSKDQLDVGAPPAVVEGMPADEQAVAIDVGAYHSIVLGSSGRVWTFGAAQLGQLGRSVFGTRSDGAGLPVDCIPKPVEGLPEQDEVVSIGAGFYNTLVCW